MLSGDGKFFLCDTNGSKIFIWNNIEDLIAGKDEEAILGVKGDSDQDKYCLLKPKIGKDTLFWPAAACFDGNYLWVGEFKFSGRLLRFSPLD